MECAGEGLTLLDFWPSPFGARVRIALAEKGVEHYKYIEENVLEDKSQLLLESNPIYKRIPVLLHDGKPINESSIIVQYIDEALNTNSTPSFMPTDAYERSQARFWVDYIDKKVIYSHGKIWRVKDSEAREQGKKEFLQMMGEFEKKLMKDEKPFFSGDSFGYLDLMLIPCTCWYYTLERFGDFIMEKECPKLMAWVKRCMERESVAAALPDPHKIYDLACSIRKKEGLDQ